MPLPLAHTIVGYSVAAASGVRFRRDTSTALLFSVVVANLPDLDFLPGALANTPALYHRTIAHTFAAALLCGLIVGAVLTRFRGRFREMALLSFLVYSSHLVADMVNFGGGNMGVQALWPFSHAWFTIPTPLGRSARSLLVFSRGHDTGGFAGSFLSWGFVRASVLQALLFTPLLLPAWWIRAKRSSGQNRSARATPPFHGRR